MKKYKKNKIKKHNRFYVGGGMKRRKNLQSKVGTNRSDNIKDRTKNIKTKEPDFELIGYINIPDISKTQLEDLESHVKLKIEKEGFENTGNDHFEFRANSRYSVRDNYIIFSGMALAFAIQYCKDNNLDCSLTWLA